MAVTHGVLPFCVVSACVPSAPLFWVGCRHGVQPGTLCPQRCASVSFPRLFCFFPLRMCLDYSCLRVRFPSGIPSRRPTAAIWPVGCHLAPVLWLLVSPFLVIYVLSARPTSVARVSLRAAGTSIYTLLHPQLKHCIIN